MCVCHSLRDSLASVSSTLSSVSPLPAGRLSAGRTAGLFFAIFARKYLFLRLCSLILFSSDGENETSGTGTSPHSWRVR